MYFFTVPTFRKRDFYENETRGYPKYCHHRPRRPRENHAGGRAFKAKRRIPGKSGSTGTCDGFQRY